MSPILEKFEQQFAGLETGKITEDDFFNTVSSNMFALRGEALPFLNKVFAYAKEREARNPKFMGLTTVLLCQLAMHEDRVEEGLKLAAKTHEIFAGINDEDGIALATTMAGSFYRTLGNIDMALKAQYTVCNVLKASGKYPFFYTASSYQLAELYVETGALDRAISHYEDSSGVADRMGYVGFYALALDGLAVAYHHTGKEDLAKDAFVKALARSEGAMFITQRTRVLSDFGTLWLDEGDYDKAVDCHRHAMELRLDANMLFAAITNMIQIGKAYKLQNKPTEALGIWQKALDLAIKINAKPKTSQVHLLLSEFYSENSDTEKALYHYKAYHAINEEVTLEDGEKKVKRAEILFAAEQTAKENAIIKAQKAEIERKNKELQETIDELTITKVSRRAKALTLLVAIVMILIEEPITHTALSYIGEENFYFSMTAKILIILSLKPIDSAIEHYLLQKIVLKKRHAAVLQHA
jgi:tetratricopeptide (TPR) repeat protein